jgi:NADPH:quinone reductase-like Zn-dependent oxidoreductase
MEAVVLREFGSPENLKPEHVPDPIAGPGEVLIRVEACGVCYHDVINRRGSLPRTSVPAILGHEAAGAVIEVGPEVDGWSVGDGAASTVARAARASARGTHGFSEKRFPVATPPS